MIYKLIIKDVTFIDSYKKSSNYGLDQLVLIGKYYSRDKTTQLQRVLIKPNMNIVINRFKSYYTEDVVPNSGSINLNARSYCLEKLLVLIAMYLLTKNWIKGYGSTPFLNDKLRNSTGATWLTYDGVNNWDNPGGDMLFTPVYNNSFIVSNDVENLNILIPSLLLLNNNGYIIKPINLFGKIYYLSNNFYDNNSSINVTLKYDDKNYVTESLLVANNSNKDLIFLILNNSYLTYNKLQTIKFNLYYLYQNKNWSTSSILTTTLAVPLNAQYLIFEYSSKNIVLNRDLIFTSISCDGTNNYFNIITNCFLKNNIYGVNIYINNIKYLTGYRFKVI